LYEVEEFMPKNFCRGDKKWLLSSSSRDSNAAACPMLTKSIPWAQASAGCISLISNWSEYSPFESIAPRRNIYLHSDQRTISICKTIDTIFAKYLGNR